MEVQPERSNNFFNTIYSVAGNILLFTIKSGIEDVKKGLISVITSPFPFAGRPVEIDLKAKVIEKYVEEVSLNKFALDHEGGSFFLFRNLYPEKSKTETLVLKVSTYHGTFKARTSPYFRNKIPVGEELDARFQVSKRDDSQLKGKELILGKVRVKLTPL